MSKPARISYAIIALLLALVGILHLATLALTILFGYFALRISVRIDAPVLRVVFNRRDFVLHVGANQAVGRGTKHA